MNELSKKDFDKILARLVKEELAVLKKILIIKLLEKFWMIWIEALMKRLRMKIENCFRSTFRRLGRVWKCPRHRKEGG